MTEPANGPRVSVVLLAAGNGTRMKSKLMKVLHPLCGRSMVGHVITAAAAIAPDHLVAVVGNGREQVGPHIQEYVPEALLAVQQILDGTGSAVRVGMEALREATGSTSGTVVVMACDTPLLQGATLAALVEDHTRGNRAVTILTGEVANPFGYGRVIRGDGGGVMAIVEQKDATVEQAAVREINSGIFAFDGDFLAGALTEITNDNANHEFYLTDVVAIAHESGLSVGAHATDDVVQTEGANDRVQLADLAAELNRRILNGWMKEGVTMVDPSTTWVDATVRLSRDVTLKPGVQLHGATTVGEDAVIGPDTTLTDVHVGEGASVVRTHATEAVIGAGAIVGPFSYLRPGTVLGAKGKIGAFVETKNAQIGDGAKVPHLSYVGDAEIGEGTNIGAGTIFANYDGVNKHRTRVGRHARTGSNNTFVAPIEIGDGAVTGGGTVVRRDVPPGALAVSAGAQRHIEDWVLTRREGTAAAAAAAAHATAAAAAAAHATAAAAAAAATAAAEANSGSSHIPQSEVVNPEDAEGQSSWVMGQQ